MSEEIKKIKRKFFAKQKLILFLAVAIAGFFIFQLLQINKHKKTKHDIQGSESNNDIFDLSGGYKDDENYDLSEITVNEMRERGAEFVYQSILKNQVQINDLKQQVQNLHSEFVKYKAQEKVVKIIFSYVDFRQNLYASRPYSENIRNLETLAFFDQNLQNKIVKLKTLLNGFNNKEQLENSFKTLIPELIATKHSAGESGWLAKVKQYLSKLVVIRRIDEKEPLEVDGIIVKIEKSLHEENYQDALNSALLLKQEYHQTLIEFLEKLNNAIEVQKVDLDILEYLKKLS